MDASALLREISQTYRNLRTLALEAVVTSEQGDENSSSRSEHRERFFYSAPDRIRFESHGHNGAVLVADGQQLHRSSRRPRFAGGPHYMSTPMARMHRLPHFFHPDFPLAPGNTPFIFQNVDERVTAAEILREEQGRHVVSVMYDLSPLKGVVVGRPVLYWVRTEDRMIMRQQGEFGQRHPLEDEVNWNRLTVSVREMRVNEPLPEDTFRFTPPPDARSEPTGSCGVSAGGASGFMDLHSDPRRRLENRSSHEWQGDTLVERSKWKIRGRVLDFERRLTFSDDEKTLHIVERILGPEGHVEHSYDLAVG